MVLQQLTRQKSNFSARCYHCSNNWLTYRLHYCILHATSLKWLLKKWSFPLKISSINVRIWSHLLEKSLMENFFFCTVFVTGYWKDWKITPISFNPVKSNVNKQTSEAATRGVLQKKVFLEIWQNSQENTCGRVSFFIKLHASGNDCFWNLFFDNGKMPLGCLYLKVRSVSFHRLKQKRMMRWVFVQFVNFWWPTWSSFILVEWHWNTFSHQRT